MRIDIQLMPKTGVKGDPEEVRITLGKVYKRHGELTPENVVQEAKKKTSPLHKEFEWDDQKAAEAHRRNQALYLIRHVEIVIQKTSKAEPVSHRLYIPKLRERSSFVDVRDAMADEETRQEMLEALHERLMNLRDELYKFEEFVGVVESIDALQIAA